MNALITGGTGGLGSAIVRQLQADGIKCSCPTHAELDLSGDIGVYFNTNTHFDIFIHAAGCNVPGSIENSGIKENWDVNVQSFVTIIKYLLPYWKETKSGQIIALSSLYGIMSRKNRFPYTVSKHALLGAVQSMALDLAQYGVKINAVCPGYMQTPMTAKNNSDAQMAEMASKIPLGRLGKPEELAKLVSFLCRENTYITGQNIIMDGGYSAGGFNGN